MAVALMMLIEYVVKISPAPLTWAKTWMSCGEKRVRIGRIACGMLAHRTAAEEEYQLSS